MSHDRGLAAILNGLAELNESRLAAPFGPIREAISDEMVEKIKVVQAIGIEMTKERGDRCPMHIPTRLCYEIIKALEAFTPPKAPGAVVDGIAVPGT